jgi:hydroxybutyrate-dimer hydrolase
MKTGTRVRPIRLTTLIVAGLAACGGDGGSSRPDGGPSSSDGGGDGMTGVNTLPAFIAGEVRTSTYDGDSDDLLTAGLGRTGLAGTAPPIADPANPTAAELRRLAIYSNYRALVDMTVPGGYGRLWGPNIDLEGGDTLGEGKIAGTETIAVSDDGSGRQSVTLMVHVPASFSPDAPCIVTATSSGSRGVYGAISAAGEWGLKRGCAVAYTDKGTGAGTHELASDTVLLVDGEVAAAGEAEASMFTSGLSGTELDAFNDEWPFRYATKHAHSQQNPEKDWGLFTLQAIQFAYWALNESFGPEVPGGKGIRYQPGSIRTIAAGVSNGGGAALAAAELDEEGWISAVVVGEPQVNLTAPAGLTIEQGGDPIGAIGSPLYDYVTVANLLQPCAAYASAAAEAPLLATVLLGVATARCAALAADGLVSGATFEAQADDALDRLHAAGYLPESDLLHAAMWGLQVSPAVAVTYANAYAGASVAENLCDFSFGPTSAKTGQAGVPPSPALMPALFGLGNGVPPTSGINIVYNEGTAGPALHVLATVDGSYAGATCLRELWTGGGALAERVQDGVDAIRQSGDLRGKPAIIVHGRSDALVPVNHSSRPYFGANRIVEGKESQLVLYEIANGQHFDGFLGVAGFDTRFVPVHYYNVAALDLMWRHLEDDVPLPPSQVVRATSRGGTPGAAPDLTVDELPAIAADPGADEITFAGDTVSVPD